MPTEQTDTTQTPPEEITYTPTVWADGEDGGTPINAANLNNIEEAIVALVERTTKQVVTSMIKDGAITSAKLDHSLRDSMSRLLGLTLSTKSDGFELVVIDASGRQFNIVVNSQRFGVWSKDNQAYLWRVEY